MPFETTLEIDCGENGKLPFNSLEDIENWNRKEGEHWQWLGPLKQSTEAMRLRSRELFKEIHLNIDKSKNGQEISGLRRIIEERYSEPRWILSSSQKGQFIGTLQEKYGDELASGALAQFLNIRENHPTPQQPVGRVLAELYCDGITPDRNVKASNDAFLEAINNAAETTKGLENTLEAMKQSHAAIKTNFEDMTEEHKQAHTTKISEHEKRMKSIEESFSVKMEMRAPVDYWISKSNDHRFLSISFGIALLLFGFGGAAGLMCYTGNYFPDLSETHNDGYIHPMMIRHLSMTIVFATAWIWATRVFARMFFSNVHLKTDADERVVMIKTYISMYDDKKLDDKEDRHLVLESIFRHGVTGIVTDDAAPAHLQITTKGTS